MKAFRLFIFSHELSLYSAELKFHRTFQFQSSTWSVVNVIDLGMILFSEFLFTTWRTTFRHKFKMEEESKNINYPELPGSWQLCWMCGTLVEASKEHQYLLWRYAYWLSCKMIQVIYAIPIIEFHSKEHQCSHNENWKRWFWFIKLLYAATRYWTKRGKVSISLGSCCLKKKDQRCIAQHK